MRQKVAPVKYIVYFVLISLIVLIISVSFAGYLNYKIDIRILIGFIAVVNLLHYLLYKYPVIDITIAAMMVASAIVFFRIKKELFLLCAVSVGQFINDAGIWFVNYFYFGTAELDSAYALFTMLVFAALISIIIFILVVGKQHVITSTLLGTALISSMWFYGYEYAFVRMQQFILVSLLLYGYNALNSNENKWRLRHDNYSKGIAFSWLGCSAAVILLAYLMAGLLPADIKPLNIQMLNEYVFSKFNDFAFNKNTQDEGLSALLRGKFNISSVGYQETPSMLGGPVKPSDKLLLKAKVQGDISGPIYLRGTVKDLYTGSLWDKTLVPESVITDKSEITGIYGNTSRVSNRSEVTLNIMARGLNTTSIFNIWQPYMADVNADNFKVDISGEMYFSKLPGGKNEYSVISKVPEIISEDLEKATPAIMLDELKKEMLSCLQLPTVTKRVEELTKEITDGKDSDFARAIAIQQYLRDTYPYTLDTSPVPAESDFVDYFLFEEKKGYCSYYASAMTIMCRIAGIPARYVEGLVLSNSDKDSDGYYYVTAQRAHAWTEVYFDGYGWIRFEPTPGYAAASYEKPSEVVSDPLPTPSDIDLPGQIEEMPDDITDDEEYTPGGLEPSERAALSWQMWLAIIVILALALRVLFKLIKSASRIRKADRLEGRDAAIEYMDMLERKLNVGGLSRGATETPSEFGIRISKAMSHYDIAIEELITLFCRVRFGNTPIDSSSRNKFKGAIKKADQFIRGRKGTLKYLVVKYIL